MLPLFNIIFFKISELGISFVFCYDEMKHVFIIYNVTLYYMLLFFLTLSCRSTSTSDSATKPLTEKNSEPTYTLPKSFVLSTQGSSTHSISFSEHTCSNNNNQIRSFWRGSGHVFVLIAEIMSNYSGVREYTVDNSTIRIKLQEEAGGSGLFYQATDDDISIDITYDGEEGLSGSATASSLEAGTLLLDPTTFYVGCPTITE
jgi:hypothetical protein